MTRIALSRSRLASLLAAARRDRRGDVGGGGRAAGSGRIGSGPAIRRRHPAVVSDPASADLPDAEQARLHAALARGGPAATRFKGLVDNWVGGAEVDAFTAWNAALIGQLTGDPKYCTAAVSAIDTQVTAAEAAIAAGNAPDVAGDDYLYIGAMIGDLALVYDWCFDAVTPAAAHALARVRQPGRVERVEPGSSATWGGTTMPWTGWAIDDPETTTTTRSCARRCCSASPRTTRTPRPTPWITQFHDTKLTRRAACRRSTPTSSAAARARAPATASRCASCSSSTTCGTQSTGEALATQDAAHPRLDARRSSTRSLPTLDLVAPTGDQVARLDRVVLRLPPQLPAGADHAVPDRSARAAERRRCSPRRRPGDERAQFMLRRTTSSTRTRTSRRRSSTASAPRTTRSGIGQLYARSGWDTHATWVNLIAGPYTESHAHQDQGSLMIYKDGWLGVRLRHRLALRPAPGGRRRTATMRIGDTGTSIPQKPGTTSTLLALHAGAGWRPRGGRHHAGVHGRVASPERSSARSSTSSPTASWSTIA